MLIPGELGTRSGLETKTTGCLAGEALCTYVNLLSRSQEDRVYSRCTDSRPIDTGACSQVQGVTKSRQAQHAYTHSQLVVVIIGRLSLPRSTLLTVASLAELVLLRAAVRRGVRALGILLGQGIDRGGHGFLRARMVARKAARRIVLGQLHFELRCTRFELAHISAKRLSVALEAQRRKGGVTHSSRKISFGVRSRYTHDARALRQFKHVGSRDAPGGAGVHLALRSLHRTQAIAPRRGVSDRLLDFAEGSGGILTLRAGGSVHLTTGRGSNVWWQEVQHDMTKQTMLEVGVVY